MMSMTDSDINIKSNLFDTIDTSHNIDNIDDIYDWEYVDKTILNIPGTQNNVKMVTYNYMDHESDAYIKRKWYYIIPRKNQTLITTIITKNGRIHNNIEIFDKKERLIRKVVTINGTYSFKLDMKLKHQIEFRFESDNIIDESYYKNGNISEKLCIKYGYDSTDITNGNLDLISNSSDNSNNSNNRWKVLENEHYKKNGMIESKTVKRSNEVNKYSITLSSFYKKGKIRCKSITVVDGSKGNNNNTIETEELYYKNGNLHSRNVREGNIDTFVEYRKNGTKLSESVSDNGRIIKMKRYDKYGVSI